MMKKNGIISLIAVVTVIRLLISFILLHNNTTSDDENNFITQALGPGILPAIGAAILDPIHTWNHLEEACFWLDNNPTLWEDSLSGGAGGSSDAPSMRDYSALYTPGTRIVAPPLVVAFLGETLVCPKSAIFLRRLLQQVILLIADAIGAYCIYKVGWRILEMEQHSNEAEMERHTMLNEKMRSLDGSYPDKFVVPGILCPPRGWVFGFPSKGLSPEEESNGKKQTEDEENEDSIAKFRLLSMVKEEPPIPPGRGDSYLDEDDVADKNKGQKKGGKKKNVHTVTIKPWEIPASIDRESIITLEQLPLIASALYFCNPISMLANATGSIRSLYDVILLLSFYYATMKPIGISKEGSPIKVPSATKVALALALATYADTGYAMFLLPILLWRGLNQAAPSGPRDIFIAQHRDWKTVFVLYFIYSVGLHYFASLLVGGDRDVYRNVMIQTMLPNIAFVQLDDSGSVPGPCMGLHWYMFVQMFDRFRPYFTVFVSGVPAMFIIPLISRLFRYPSVLVATFQLLWVIFRPTSTVHTLTLGLILALLNPRTVVRMRDPSLVSFCALPVPILLFITFHRMWLVTGNGNPNYIYFQCFAYGMFVVIISMDFVSATVKRDKVRRMIERPGTIKKIIEKRKDQEGETKKEKDGECNSNGVTKEAEVQKNAGAQKKEVADVSAPWAVKEKEATEVMESDSDDQPEPNVVFI